MKDIQITLSVATQLLSVKILVNAVQFKNRMSNTSDLQEVSSPSCSTVIMQNYS